MPPLVVLTVLFLVFTLLGRLSIPSPFGWYTALRLALGWMFLFTASAHWGKRRADLIRMFPPLCLDPTFSLPLRASWRCWAASG